MSKGYIFTVDAILSLIVLTVGFLIIFPPVSQRPDESVTLTASAETLNIMMHSPISGRNIQSIRDLYQTPPIVINDPTISPLEAIALLQYRSLPVIEDNPLLATHAKTISDTYLEESLGNKNLNYRLFFEDPMNNKNLTRTPNAPIISQRGSDSSLEDSESLISSRRIVFFNYNNRVMGPVVARLDVWK